MSKQFAIAMVGICILMMSVLIIVLVDNKPSSNAIGGNMNCLRTYNLPVGERLVGATDHEVLTTISPGTEAKSYRLRAYNGTFCATVQER